MTSRAATFLFLGLAVASLYLQWLSFKREKTP